MRALPARPSLYRINARVWLTELSRQLRKTVTLDEIPDAELDRLAQMGFGVSYRQRTDCPSLMQSSVPTPHCPVSAVGGSSTRMPVSVWAARAVA